MEHATVGMDGILWWQSDATQTTRLGLDDWQLQILVKNVPSSHLILQMLESAKCSSPIHQKTSLYKAEFQQQSN